MPSTPSSLSPLRSVRWLALPLDQLHALSPPQVSSRAPAGLPLPRAVCVCVCVCLPAPQQRLCPLPGPRGGLVLRPLPPPSLPPQCGEPPGLPALFLHGGHPAVQQLVLLPGRGKGGRASLLGGDWGGLPMGFPQLLLLFPHPPPPRSLPPSVLETSKASRWSTVSEASGC